MKTLWLITVHDYDSSWVNRPYYGRPSKDQLKDFFMKSEGIHEEKAGDIAKELYECYTTEAGHYIYYLETFCLTEGEEDA